MVGHRYYNPEWGRWIQPDDIEYLDPTNINGLNLYAYCNNDPVNMIDPDGHFAISAFAAALLIGIGVGAAFGAGFSLAGALAEGETGWDLFWDVAGGALMGAAVGATAVLGGAAGLASVGVTVSGYTLTASAALGYSMLATAAGGMVKYGFDYIASPNADQFSVEQLVFSGINGGIQGLSTFLIAYTAGKNGIFNNTFKLNLTRGLKSSIIAFSKKLLFSTMPAAISRFLLGSIIVNERK